MKHYLSHEKARFGALDFAVLTLIAVLGLVNLPIPFHGDQALFNLGAEAVARGAVPYRDFWDLKQPGVYGFYLVAGTLFGFTEIGIHAFEMFYMVCFSAILAVALKSYYQHRALAALASLLTVGMYYGVAGSWHLTQVEGLVGFPLFLCLWFASTPPRPGGSRALRLFLSGVMGGVVLFFKLMFLPLLLAFWLVAFFVAGRQEGESLVAAGARPGAAIVGGVLCVLVPVVGYFAWAGVLPLVYQTFIEYPPRMLHELPASGYGSLLGGLAWFAKNFGPMMALALIGSSLSLARRRDGVTLNLVVWCLLGFATILLQRRSWWEYQYLLLLVPLAVLAVRAIDLLWPLDRTAERRTSDRPLRAAGVVALILLFSPAEAAWVQKAAYLAYHGFAVETDQRLAYQQRFSRDYPEMAADVAFLSDPRSRPGDIYVCGSPVFYYLSGRKQAVALNGWALELFLPEQWDELVRQLAVALPAYIFVQDAYRDLIPERSVRVASFLNRHYCLRRPGVGGVWYELVEPGSARFIAVTSAAKGEVLLVDREGLSVVRTVAPTSFTSPSKISATILKERTRTASGTTSTGSYRLEQRIGISPA